MDLGPIDKIKWVDLGYWNFEDNTGEIHVYFMDGTSEVYTEWEAMTNLFGYNDYVERAIKEVKPWT